MNGKQGMELLPFELTIRPQGKELVVSAHTPAGDVSAPLPLGWEEVEAWGKVSRGKSLVAEAVEGRYQLFETLFPGAVRDRYRESLGMARERGARLSISLRCDYPPLMLVPWELAHDPVEERPLVVSLRTPFSRTLSLARPPVPLEGDTPVRLQVVTAAPAGYPPLDIAGELRQMEQVLQPLIDRDLLELRLLRHATPEEVRRVLGEQPHLLHIIAHGNQTASGRAELVLEDKYGDPLALSSEELAASLSGAGLRCVLLMACHTAEMTPDGPDLVTLGPLLLDAGVGAVVLLDTELPDQAAIAFSGAFYRALGDGEAVAVAMNRARQELWAVQSMSGTDWAVPILFTRDPGGRVLLPTREEAPHNLPAPATPLIGRQRELEELMQQVQKQRLVTLTGPGGTGKTRLALEVAHHSLPLFRDGVFFIQLASLQDQEQVPGAITRELKVQERAGQPVMETLQSALKERKLLLVLDNFEHLMSAAAVVGELLAAAAQLTVLATSRERLQLTTEYQYRLSPLDVPQRSDPRGEVPVGELASFPAVELFRQRAQMAAPSFDLTTTNAGAVAGICRRLDGLPLAIVLAAARIELFGTPGALLQRLEEDLSVLKSAAPDLPERQKTLQVAISWSYDLLTEEEQRLFRRLAVFVGGHTVEAVEKVCNRDKDLGMDVLDGVGALLDKSLIEARTGSDAGRRFTMLQTIGDYAGVRLEQSGELGKIRQYHAEYYLQFAEQAAAALSGAEQQSWLQRLDAEHDNLLAAQRWTAEQQEEEIDVRLAAALWRYWDVRGYLTEGRHYLAGTLQRTSEPSQERAQVLYGASVLAWRQGDFKPAQSYLEECLTVSEEVAYRRGRADALNMMANIALYQSEFERAEDLYQQALALQRKEDDVQGAAISLGNLGIIAAEQGDFAAARSFLEESLTLREELGHERDIAQVLHNLGEVALRGGDYGDARRYLDQSLKMRERLADKLGLAATLHSLGLVSVQEGDRATARRLLDESISMRRELEHRWGLAYALYDLGQLALEETDSGRAAQLYREALELNHSLKNTQGIVQCLEACSRLLGLQKKYSDAVAVLAAAQVLRRTNGLAAAEPEQRRLEEHLQQLREALPRNSFEDVWEKGAAWSSDEAVAYSLGSLTNFTPSPLPE